MDRAIQYVVYRFQKAEPIDIGNPSRIVAITRDTYLPLPYLNGQTEYVYVVTALDRLQNESRPVSKKVKL